MCFFFLKYCIQLSIHFYPTIKTFINSLLINNKHTNRPMKGPLKLTHLNKHVALWLICSAVHLNWVNSVIPLIRTERYKLAKRWYSTKTIAIIFFPVKPWPLLAVLLFSPDKFLPVIKPVCPNEGGSERAVSVRTLHYVIGKKYLTVGIICK